jgi:hypothetical protein
MSEKLFVKLKLSRWRAKIVTSLLPQPSVLGGRSTFLSSSTKLVFLPVITWGIQSHLFLSLLILLCHYIEGFCYFVLDLGFIPTIMSIADKEKIAGQSLNGRKSILNPVNKETIARENNMITIDR